MSNDFHFNFYVSFEAHYRSLKLYKTYNVFIHWLFNLNSNFDVKLVLSCKFLYQTSVKERGNVLLSSLCKLADKKNDCSLPDYLSVKVGFIRWYHSRDLFHCSNNISQNSINPTIHLKSSKYQSCLSSIQHFFQSFSFKSNHFMNENDKWFTRTFLDD